mmetsp:Transcript_38237/g.101072  ORF Transcript_38237/g.101072 Transcript_38237/m.101072 type:complete len:702 (+) Transcript_38237:76-2181(+)
MNCALCGCSCQDGDIVGRWSFNLDNKFYSYTITDTGGRVGFRQVFDNGVDISGELHSSDEWLQAQLTEKGGDDHGNIRLRVCESGRLLSNHKAKDVTSWGLDVVATKASGNSDFRLTCGHVACDACLQEHIANQRLWSVPQSHVRCFHEGCSCLLPASLTERFVIEAAGPAEAPRDLASQLKIEALKRSRTLVDALVIGSKLVCAACQRHESMLVANEGCHHAACQECWTDLVESAVDAARARRRRLPRVQCLAPGCTHRASARVLNMVAAYRCYSSEVDAEVRRLRLSASSVLVCEDGSDEPECPACHDPVLALLENPGCCHRACERCWMRLGERHVQRCRDRCLPQLYAPCIRGGCAQMMSQDIVRHSATLSARVRQFSADLSAEVARFTSTACESVVLGSTDSGPTCTFCGKTCLAVLANGACPHVACEACWARCVEAQVPRCRERRLADVHGQCIGQDCSMAISSNILKHVCTISTSVKSFKDEIGQELQRLCVFCGDLLDFGPTPSEVGPECGVCRERCVALMTSGGCEHAACEDCWASWIEAQIPRCRAHKAPTALRCFGPGCPTTASTQLWQHACGRSGRVQAMEAEFAYRRRLQDNALFPAAVQVDCPVPGCLGLGYRGYDTLMCFVCEHTWSADDTDALPVVDVDIERELGDTIKKCPGCGEFIMKNGGCDHMTCRCLHEFFWSTLLPYRTR